MFTSWLFEQQDRDDAIGYFSKVAYSDYNAGCAAHFKTAVDWKNHFNEKHTSKFNQLFDLLSDAYVEYAKDPSW